MDLDRYRSVIPEWSRFVEASARPEPTVFRVREGRIDEDALIARLVERGFRTEPLAGMPGFHQVVEGPCPVSMTIEHWLGLLYVQQASTGVAAPALGPRPRERVLDLCSAPGGKTAHMAELMDDTGCLVASEISESRIRGLLGNLYRLGHTNALVVAGDGRGFPEGALFDRVLVDAPCSGEGTLRRRGGQPPHQSRSFLGFVTNAQKELLERAVQLTRPGGTVLYVTCTFAPEENEAVVSDALSRLPVELEPLELPVPHARGLTSFDGVRFDPRLEGAARIYPHHLDSGGLFLARLRRLDGDTGGAPREPVKEVDMARAAGAAGGAAGADESSGWRAVPSVFPDDPMSAENAWSAVDLASDELQGRFGIDVARSELRWIARGGRLWAHTVDEWPLSAWEPGAWRPISVGYRAVDFDSRGRPRPTNDLLRLSGAAVTERTVDLDDESLMSVLKRNPVQVAIEARGPIALRYRGDLVGRGAVTVDGLKSEVPKARAADLRRILDTGSAGS